MGGSKATTVGYWYQPMFHHGLCEGPVDVFLEFRCGDKVAWSGSLSQSGQVQVNAPNLFGGESDQGGIVGTLDVMFGEATQQPNDYLLSALGGQVPGWRGMSTVVWRGGKYGAMNPYPAAASYKVARAKKNWPDDACWYEEKAAIGMRLTASGQKLALYFAIDLSGSMGGGRLDNMKVALNAVLDQLAESIATGTRMDVMFSGFSEPQMIVQRDCTAADIAALKAWVDARIASGGTDFSQGTADMGEFYAGVAISDARIAFFITDGEPNSPDVVTAARADVDAVPGLRCYGINIDMVNTTYTAQVQNVDGPVAVVEGGNPDAMTAVIRTSLYSNLIGMNLAHALYQSCTDPGMGREPIDSMDDANWRAAADWFSANGVGICTDREPQKESVAEFRERIQKVGACSVQRSPLDGKLRLNIVNGLYDLDSLPVITDDDILEFNKQPTLLAGAVNSLAVKYFDPDQKQSVTTPPMQALDLIDAFGLNHQVIEFPEIPTQELALRVAERELRARCTPLQAFDLKLMPGAGYALQPDQYVRLQSRKRRVADMVCIVGGKQEGSLKSGAIAVQLTQDIFTLPQTVVVEVEPGVSTAPDGLPKPITVQRAFEAPYVELARTLPNGELAALPVDAAFIQAVALDPASSRNYTLMAAPEALEYEEVGAGDWCPSALIAESDDDGLATQFSVVAGSRLDRVPMGSAALWKNEIVRMDALDAAAGTITLARGCADTVPQPHAAGERIWFYDDGAAIDATEYAAGEVVNIKLLTNTGSAQLPQNAATAMPVTLTGRAALPYPPANLQVNAAWPAPASATGDVVLTWAHRDRVLQADKLVDWYAASIGPAEDTRYGIRIQPSIGLPVAERNDVAGNTATLRSAYTGVITVEVWAINNAGDSLQVATFALDYTPAEGNTEDAIIAPTWTPPQTIIDGGEVTGG